MSDKIFDKNIAGDLEKKNSLNAYSIFSKFLSTHCTKRTYHFCIFKCESNDCLFHRPIHSDPIEMFGDPVPYQDDDNTEHYPLGENPEQKYMPSKLENPAKQKHGLSFLPTA